MNKLKIRNIVDNVPLSYRVLLFALLYDLVSWLIVEGSRSSGKSTFMYDTEKVVFIFIVLFPEADVVLVNKYKNGHSKTKAKLKKVFKEASTMYPILADFFFTEYDGVEVMERANPNGTFQRIHFGFTKNKGVEKLKSLNMFVDGYISLWTYDEAEDNNGDIDESTQEANLQMIHDLDLTFNRRDNVKYKNLIKYPRTKFYAAFNPKVENGAFESLFDDTLIPDIEKLEKDGYQYKIIPQYNGGSGLMLVRNNIYALINDPNTDFHPVATDIQRMEYVKKTDYNTYLTDFLGIRIVAQDNFFKRDRALFVTEMPTNVYPVRVGIDTGIVDNSGLVVRARALEEDLKGNFIGYSKSAVVKSIPIDELLINGIKKKAKAKEKDQHSKAVAETMADKILEVSYTNKSPNLIKYYMENDFLICYGPNDHWLAIKIQEILEKKIGKYADMYDFVEITDSKHKYNLESRYTLRQHAVIDGKEFLSHELTPKLYDGLMKVNKRNWRNNNNRYLDLIDADFYAGYYDYIDI